MPRDARDRPPVSVNTGPYNVQLTAPAAPMNNSDAQQRRPRRTGPLELMAGAVRARSAREQR